MNDYLGLEMYVSYDTYFNIDHYNKYKKERREDLISKLAYTTIYDIINESYEKNLIFANNVYGSRTLVGINSTHKINHPAPIIKAEDFLLKK